MNDTVTIIIVNYNGERFLVDCLDSIREQTYKKLQVIVFDNASADGSVELIRRKYPEVKLIESDKNIGYCAANNYCLKELLESQRKYALLLNADMILQKDCLERLINTADNQKESGIFSPRILRFPETDKIWYAGGTIDFKRGITRFGTGEIDAAFIHVPGKTEFVCGCSMLIRRTFIEKIGLFDPDFFAYYEDADLSVRANNAGMGCYYEPRAIAYHKGGDIESPYSAYYFHRNRFLFVSKHATFIQRLYFYPFIIKNQVMHILKFRKQGKLLMAESLWKGLVDGLLNRVGKVV